MLSFTMLKLCLLYLLFLYLSATFGHTNEPSVVTVISKEGDDAMLPCSLSTRENIVQTVFDWKKDDQKEVFLYDAGIHYNNGRVGQDQQFKGRVSHFPGQLQFGNASIIIQNTTESDSGTYSCIFPHIQPHAQRFKIQLQIGAAQKPHVTILKVTEDWVLMMCEVRGAFPQPKVEWQDSDGKVLPAEDPQVSYRDNHYSVTLITTVTKTTTNRFLCVVTQDDIKHRTAADIYAPFCEPSVVTVISKEGDDAMLPCSLSTRENIVQTVFDWKKDDQKEVFLYDAGIHYNNGRSGQDQQFKGRVSHFPGQLESGNASIIIRSTTESDSGTYSCFFPHIQPHAQRFKVQLLIEPAFNHSAGIFMAGWFSGFITLGAPLAVLLVIKYIRKRPKKGSYQQTKGLDNSTALSPDQEV